MTTDPDEFLKMPAQKTECLMYLTILTFNKESKFSYLVKLR